MAEMSNRYAGAIRSVLKCSGAANHVRDVRMSAARRWCEVRIGELLGPAEQGDRTDLSLAPAGVSLDRHERHEFRLMAKPEHRPIVEEATGEGEVSRARILERIQAAGLPALALAKLVEGLSCRRVLSVAVGLLHHMLKIFDRLLALSKSGEGEPPREIRRQPIWGSRDLFGRDAHDLRVLAVLFEADDLLKHAVFFTGDDFDRPRSAFAASAIEVPRRVLTAPGLRGRGLESFDLLLLGREICPVSPERRFRRCQPTVGAPKFGLQGSLPCALFLRRKGGDSVADALPDHVGTDQHQRNDSDCHPSHNGIGLAECLDVVPPGHWKTPPFRPADYHHRRQGALL